MDSCWKDDYPSDLWKGNISPLVFAVNASPNGGYKDEFEWFLQAMIQSVEDEVDSTAILKSTSSLLTDPLEALLSLDPTTLGTNHNNTTPTTGSSTENSNNRNLLSRRISLMKSSSKSIEIKDDETTLSKNKNTTNNNNNNTNVGLYHGTGLFFQTARVIPVSKKHAFPPSKDATGTKNKNKAFQQQQHQTSSSPLMMGLGSRHGHSSSTTNNTTTTTTPTSSSLHGVSGERRIHSSKTTTTTNTNTPTSMMESIDGILPQAWLEKHAHALPSVLLVVAVVELSSDLYQMAQIEQSLSQSCEALKSSLASKRECKLHLILLTTTSTTTMNTVQCNEKCDSIRTICRTSYFTTLPLPTMSTSDNDVNPFLLLQQQQSSSNSNSNKPILQKIAKSLRDASLEYYLNQVRRAKRKHSLTEEQEEYQIRYCFKIATFYEFFGSEEKALKYYTQAYKSILDYYQYLTQTIGLSNILPSSSNNNNNKKKDNKNNHQLNRNRSSSFSSVPKLKTTNDTLTSILSQNEEEEEEEERPFDEEDDDEKTSYLPNNLMSTPPPPTTTTTSHQESIEVTYNAPTLSSSQSQNNNYPPDILHQCRGTADWLNYKLLTFLLAIYQDITTVISTEPTDPLSSPTTTTTTTTTTTVETVLMAYMTQCRRHSQTFFTKLSSSQQKEEEEPLWHYWQYICQQRMVMAYMGHQLFSSNQELSFPTNAIAQMMASCESWKQYATLAENLLQLDSCLQEEKKLNSTSSSNPQELLNESSSSIASSVASTVHGWFVGSINDAELQLKLQEECTKNHKELALNCILRAINLWEVSTEEGPKNKKGSRLHYIAGGIYYQKGIYDKAEYHYRQSKQLLSQWPFLQVAVSRALLSCIQKQQQQQEEKEDAQELSMSLLLNPRTSLLLSHQDLNQYTQNMFTQSKLATNKKYFESASFVFAVTFPKYHSATAGNVVDALLTLESKVPFLVEICDLILQTNMGPITVEAPGLINFQQLVQLPFQMTLPTDLSSITVGESSDSIVKSNKSNASGLTYCGGGTVLKEEDTSDNRQFLLGGMVVSCTSLQITLRHSTTDRTNTVQMEVQNPFRGSLPVPESSLKPTAVVLAKRTNFEEDNYISSAWACPEQFSLYAGPRCLRIHLPQPQLLVTDLTAKFTSGKALEGTVNRIVLELKAVDEACYDMQFTVNCTSCYIQQSELEEEEKEESASATMVQRRPILVQYHPGSTSTETELVDWKSLGEGNETDWRSIQPLLEKNETCCTWFDLYRPLPTSPLNAMHSPLDQCDLEENINDIHCRTNYTIQVTHRTSGSSGVVVKKEFMGHVDWCQPLVVDTAIIPGNHSRYPSGNRHPTNQITQDNNSAKLGIPIAATDAVAVNDGSCLGVRLTASAKEPHFTILLEHITFNPNTAVSTKEEDEDDKNHTACELRLMNNGSKSDETESNVLFVPCGKKNEFAHILKAHCKFRTTFFVQPQLMGCGNKSGVLNCTTNLGVLEVRWKPKGYSLPPTKALVTCHDPFKDCLGPLSMIQQIDSIKAYGPLCYIERAPFDASLSLIPTATKVATPFEVVYTITNQTIVPQELSVTLSPQDTNSNVVLVSGLMTGPIHLGPKETSRLIYMILANSPGRMSLPCINVTSQRHGTWIIRSNPDNSPRVFVMP